jgi:hypothetical protein
MHDNIFNNLICKVYRLKDGPTNILGIYKDSLFLPPRRIIAYAGERDNGTNSLIRFQPLKEDSCYNSASLPSYMLFMLKFVLNLELIEPQTLNPWSISTLNQLGASLWSSP